MRLVKKKKRQITGTLLGLCCLRIQALLQPLVRAPLCCAVCGPRPLAVRYQAGAAHVAAHIYSTVGQAHLAHQSSSGVHVLTHRHHLDLEGLADEE